MSDTNAVNPEVPQAGGPETTNASETTILEKPGIVAESDLVSPPTQAALPPESPVQDAQPATEAVEPVAEEVDKTVHFKVTEEDATNLYFTLQCLDRDTLKAYDKQRALDFVLEQEAKFAKWSQAGIEIQAWLYHHNLNDGQPVDPRLVKDSSGLILASDYRLTRLP